MAGQGSRSIRFVNENVFDLFSLQRLVYRPSENGKAKIGAIAGKRINMRASVAITLLSATILAGSAPAFAQTTNGSGRLRPPRLPRPEKSSSPPSGAAKASSACRSA
jgi:hypothetical protein